MGLKPWERNEREYEGSRVYHWLDERFDLSNESLFGKAFPEGRYGSFLLGEVALFTFVLLVLSGTFLGLLYKPSVQEVKYSGPVSDFNGQQVPEAFASVLHITYAVPFGDYIRMFHHWGAYIFIAAMGLHMLRIFFSASYRNPREINWVVGSVLLLLGLVEGFLGYALPYDNFSATATTIGFEMTGAVPIIGTQLKRLAFGGDFPVNADAVIPRIFFLHVFLVPLIILGLIGLHLALLVRQKHTEDPGERTDLKDFVKDDDDSVVVGLPLLPNQAVVTAIVFFVTMAILSFLAAFFPVQNIVHTGPTSALTTPPNVGPDWYFMWVYGYLKMTPSALGDYSRLVGGIILPGVTITLLVLWPFIDKVRDQRHFTANPLKRPAQTAIGVAAISFVMTMSVAGMNSTVAEMFNTTVGGVYTGLLVYSIALPVISGLIVFFMLRHANRTGRFERKAPASERGEPADD